MKLKKLATLSIVLFGAVTAGTLMTLATTVAPPASKLPRATTAAGKPAARSAALGLGPKSPITISLKTSIRHGNLIVLVDGVPIFNEEFRKPALFISQTTRWDPLPVTAGKHRLTAKVYTTTGKTYLSGVYELELSRTKGIELRIRTKGDALTVERAS